MLSESTLTKVSKVDACAATFCNAKKMLLAPVLSVGSQFYRLLHHARHTFLVRMCANFKYASVLKLKEA